MAYREFLNTILSYTNLIVTANISSSLFPGDRFQFGYLCQLQHSEVYRTDSLDLRMSTCSEVQADTFDR